MCLLVPFWDDVLYTAGYVPKYIHTHRDVREVALSLSHWAGYDPAYGQLLWLRYVLEAEAATRGKARIFTSYHKIMKDWSVVAQRTSDALDLVWPSYSDRVCAEIEEFLDQDLQHMKARSEGRGGGRLSPWAAETFEIMERWAENGEDPNDHVTLNAIRENFNLATPVFSTLVETGRRDAVSLQVKAQEEKQTLIRLESLQSETTKAQEGLNAAQGESAELRRLAEEAQAQVQTLNAAQEQSRAERAEVQVRLEAAQGEGAELRRLAEEAQAQVQTLNAAQEQSRAERAEVQARLEAAQGELGSAHALLDQIEGEAKELRHRKSSLESELSQRSHEAEEVGGQLANARHDIERLAGERDKVIADRDALFAEREQVTRKFRVEKVQLEKQLREKLATALQRHRERDDSAQAQIRAIQAALDLTSEKVQTLVADKAALQLSLEKSAAGTKRAESQLEAAQGEGAELRRLAQEAQAQIQTLNAAQEQALEHQREAEAKSKDLLDSTSWRITAPLRRVVLAYRGFWKQT